MNQVRIARLLRELADEFDRQAPSVKSTEPRRKRTFTPRPTAPVSESDVANMRRLCAKRGIPV